MSNNSLIQGAVHEDPRGRLSFFNTFNLSKIQRMYQIQPASEDSIRAWQGHKVEQKWFYCTEGSFIINLVKIADFVEPDRTTKATQYTITASNPQVLHVIGGNATGIKSTAPNSKLLVFSDVSVTASQKDDFRFEPDFWKANWEVRSEK